MSGNLRGKTRETAKPGKRRHVAVVSGLAEALAAATAAEAEGAALLIVSESGAAAYLGAGYFAALVAAVREAYPGLSVEGALDCGADPGWALAALRCRIRYVILAREVPAWSRVAAIARRSGAQLLPSPPRAWPQRPPAGAKAAPVARRRRGV